MRQLSSLWSLHEMIVLPLIATWDDCPPSDHYMRWLSSLWSCRMSINIDMIIFDLRLVLRHFLIPLIMKLVSICLLCITQIIILCPPSDRYMRRLSSLWSLHEMIVLPLIATWDDCPEGGQSSHVAIRGRTIVSCSDQREDNRLM
jgi:hypothetical protein